MKTRHLDRRTSRDFLTSSAALLALTGLLAGIAAWYLKPPRAYPVPPLRSRVAYLRERADRGALAPIHFSLPSKIGFSRTVQLGDPRLPTTLGHRPEWVRFLPRPAVPVSMPTPQPPAPAFEPWPQEAPVFPPVATSRLVWTILVEGAEEAGCRLPAALAEAADWPASGSWTAVVFLEGEADGRVRHLFVMPPAPESGVTARLAAQLRQARFEGAARRCRVKISRIEVPSDPDREGNGTT